MKYWTEFNSHNPDIFGTRKKIDNTIYTFDIETTSFLILNGKMIPAIKYLDLTEKEREICEFRSNMYIWQFSINEEVYFGRTWNEFKIFLNKLENCCPVRKIVFVHNLSFEFQYLKGEFYFKDVLARKSHKVMRAIFENYNIELRCSYMMSNCALKYLPKLFKLNVEKQVGDLDYTLIRHNKTILTDKELKYCEYDCLVVYEYIKKMIEQYKRVDKIPLTNTGQVRRELKERIEKNWSYKAKVRKSINTDPHVYNLLQDCFAGRLYTFQLGLYR